MKVMQGHLSTNNNKIVRTTVINYVHNFLKAYDKNKIYIDIHPSTLKCYSVEKG